MLVAHTVAPGLQTPASRTWDAAFDYRLNARWAFHTGVLNREGRNELIVTPLTAGSVAERRLSSDGRSSYRDVEVSAHYTRGATVDAAPGGRRRVCSGGHAALVLPLLPR